MFTTLRQYLNESDRLIPSRKYVYNEGVGQFCINYKDVQDNVNRIPPHVAGTEEDGVPYFFEMA